MNLVGRVTSGTVMILFSGLVTAGEYRTPANMSTEDRQALMAGSREYEQCVTSRLRELAPKVGDPRALADAAMASCSETLTAFAEQMAADNYHPDFSNYYLGKVKNRVAGNAVQQAMFIASQKQRRHEQEGKQGDEPPTSE